jgi:hypothetical protein
MPHLIYDPPGSARYHLTPDKFAALVTSLRSNKDASNMVVNDNFGAVTYQKIDFAWNYDGSDVLTVTIVADHNWKGKIAGNEAIFGELYDDLISKL